MSNNDFFQEEKCVPMRRAPSKKPAPLPRELKPKFPMEPVAPAPVPTPPARVTPPPPMAPAPMIQAPVQSPMTPPPLQPSPRATPTGTEQEKSQNKEDGQGNTPVQPVVAETSANAEEVKSENQEGGVKDPLAENQNAEGQEPKKKKKPKKDKAPKKPEEGVAVAVFMEDDDDPGAFANPDKLAKGAKKEKEVPVAGQVMFVDEEEEEKEAKKPKKDKEKKKVDKKEKAMVKGERPGSVRQKKHALPAAFTAFAPANGAAAPASVNQKKDAGSARKKKANPVVKPPPKPPVAPPVTPPVAVAPVGKEKDRAAREPNEGFFKAMYSKAKTKIVAMSKNPNTPASSSSSSSSSTSTSTSSMSGSDDTLIATDAAMALKNEVAAVYGTSADYPRGAIPPKTSANHPDKLFPEGRPYWLNRDEKPPEAKVILMSLVNQCIKDGTLTLVDKQDEPNELTPYAEDIKPMKAKDDQYVLDASRILANTVHNTIKMRAVAFGALKAPNAKKPLDKPKVGKLKFIPPTQCAVYNRKQQKQKKFTKFPFKTATGSDAHKAMTKKKKKNSDSSCDN